MPQTYIGDVSGTRRALSHIEVHDASAQRVIRQGWVGDASGVNRLIFLGGDLLTLVAAATKPDNNGNISYGYDGLSENPIGSLTPNTLGDGSKVYLLESNQQVNSPLNTPGYYSFALNAPSSAGYNAENPLPQSYLTQLIISGPGIGTQTLSGASAVFVRDATNNGGWGWGPGLPAFEAGQTYQVIVVRANAS